MTEHTKLALQQATEALTAAQSEATQQKRACLAQIAVELPALASGRAKRVAVEQPDVAKKLGKEGVAEMRAELREAAEELGGMFVAGENDIDWPPVATSYGVADNRDLRNALTKRFARHTEPLIRVLTTRGFRPDEWAFHPQSLFDDSKFGPLAKALTDVHQAKRQVVEARRADDNSTVDDLWGE